MFTTHRVLFIVFALIFATLPSSAPAKDSPKKENCVAYLTPATSGQASKKVEGPCFETLAEAVAAATGDRVKLPKTATPQQIDKALREDTAQENGVAGVDAEYVLSIEYWNANFSSPTYTWSGTSSCASAYYYTDTINYCC